MALLVLILLIPWLEASLQMRQAAELAQLRLDSPWTLFYAFMVVVGVTNYVPTRFSLAAIGFAVTFFVEYLGLTRLDWAAERRAILWSWVAWTVALSVWLARWRASYGPADRNPFERLWFGFAMRGDWSGRYAF
jgi:hypothetical protein